MNKLVKIMDLPTKSGEGDNTCLFIYYDRLSMHGILVEDLIKQL